MVAINFNATSVDPSAGGGDIFETGEYAFQIVKSDVKGTKAGNGTMLVFEAACIEEGFNGKRLTIRLNVQNPNPTAVEIAYRDLSAICHVVGVLQLTDTQQLHGKPFRIRLEKLPRPDAPDKFTNEIRAYLDMAGNPPTKGQPAGGGTAAPQAPAAPQQPAAPAPQPQAAAPAAVGQPVSSPAPSAAPAPAPQPPQSAPAAAASTPPWQQGASSGEAAPSAAPSGVPPWQQ